MAPVSRTALTLALAAAMTAAPLTFALDEHGILKIKPSVAWAKNGGDDGDDGDDGGGNSGPGGGGSSGRGGGDDGDDDGGNSGRGGGDDGDDGDDDGGNSGHGGGDDGDDGDDDGGNSGRGGGDDDGDDNSGRGSDDDRADDRDDDRDDDRSGRGRGRGSDDSRRDDSNEVTFSDGSRIEIENGRFERKDPQGRTIEERPATAADRAMLANARSHNVDRRAGFGRARGGGVVASFEINGRDVEVTYVDGWKEEIENGRYEMKDANNNTVVERNATQRDVDRLFGAFQ